MTDGTHSRQYLAPGILRDALDCPADERGAFIDARCEGDAALREHVHRLLAGADDSDLATGVADDGPPDEPLDRFIGSTLGPFRVVECVGRGGMGVVYRAHREGADFDQEVAIKLIRRGFDFDDVQARFLRERRILARLSHPNLAHFIDGGVSSDGRPWFALEFVRGTTITQWCDGQRLDVRARVRLFLDICAAVRHAHAQLVVHRDLKPGNIMVDASGVVRLLDFGIAGLLEGDAGNASMSTAPGHRPAMTPEYAAPEQFSGEPAGVATDVYSLGVILYELVSGVRPYDVGRAGFAAAERVVRETLPQPLSQAISRASSPPDEAPEAHQARSPLRMSEVASPPRNPDSAAVDDGIEVRLVARATHVRAYRKQVRGDLSRIIEKALAKDPSCRYPTVETFSEDLSRWLAGAPVRVTGNRFGYRLAKFVGRNRVAAASAALTLIALVAAGSFAFYSAWREGIQRDVAVAEAARANAVREYVMLMFGDAADRSGATTVTARDVLKQGAGEIFTRFADRPEAGQDIALNLSDLFLALGDSEGAVPLLEGLLAWPGIDRNPSVLASARYNLAQVEYSRGKTPRAQELLDQSQAFWATQPERFRSILSESRSVQAQLQRAEGHTDLAVATLESAIAERRAFLGTSDREVGSALNALSLALMQLGRYEETIDRANEAYKVFESIGQARSATGLATINNRALAEGYLGRHAEAEADNRLVVAARRELYGESPELAAAQNNLALSLTRRKNYAEAIPLFEDALRMGIAQRGDSGREATMARINLAEAYAATDRVTEAAALAEEAVASAETHYGAHSVYAGVAHRARANVRLVQGRIVEAREDLATATTVFDAMGKGGAIYLKSLADIREKLGAH
ncbi:MAG: protein kinase [Dokdonella sp.]|uniref:protein kinase domain-containing protein n=1 Tax=Dokdonella sp. TaxID=2291710 RepID=UPI003267F9D8